jgi:tetratricopeptide (TPR) repeat protein
MNQEYRQINTNRLTILSVILILVLISSCKNQPNKQDEIKSEPNTDSIIQMDQNIPDSLREQNIEKLAEKGDYKNVISQIDQLLNKNKENPAWLFMKADALEKTGDTAQAIAYYQYSIESAGKFTEASARLANLYAEKGDKNALAACDALLKEPTAISLRSNILFMKGIYFLRSGQPANGLNMFDQIIREDYTFLDAYLEKGIYYFDQKNYAEARKVFEKSTSVKNSFADGYYWMAKCDENLNNKPEAIDNYKRSIALDPGFKEAREALARLQSNQ